VPEEERCIAVHPSLGAVCRLHAHPYDRAHFAAGVEDDGTQWSLFWWRPADVHADPGGRADRTGRR
jgi:hypothetical protein